MLKYTGLGMTKSKAMEITSMTRHSFYYKPKGGKRGRKKSETTPLRKEEVIEQVFNEVVVEEMKAINIDPDTRCGYKRMCCMLMLMGYYINRKKVRRLMAESGMLQPQIRRASKTYARYRIVMPKGPLEVLEMDIKYVWIDGARRNAFILTVIDTFTRVVLCWKVGFTMRSMQVKQIWEEIISTHFQDYDMLNRKIVIEIRNDNGPQFASKVIQDFFKENYLNQVFTHPYTPQENGHIESFHNTLSNSIDASYWALESLEQRLNKFYEAYNNIRVHSSIAGLPPQMFWNAWNYDLVEMIEKPKKRVQFKLRCDYQDLSGIMNQREHLSSTNGAKHADINTEAVSQTQVPPTMLSYRSINHRREHLSQQ